jgi:antitoxin component YwqK of YwqJK toxin-antitoxin module
VATLVACELRGKPHGPGARYLDDGTVIAQLTFANGLLEGPVTLHDTITGSYKAGKRHGTWSLSDDDTGTRIVVELADGVAHGAYSRSTPDEEVSGAYARGKRTGAWTYRTDGGGARGSYAGDMRTGEWVLAYPSSTVAARGRYKAGKRQAGWKFFVPDGKAITETVALATEWIAAALADDASTDRAVIYAFTTGQ